MATRIYAVNLMIATEGTAYGEDYLVDATNVNAAMRHVARKHITAHPADGKTVARLMAAGVKPEAVDDAADPSC